jgi:hypothetical protein
MQFPIHPDRGNSRVFSVLACHDTNLKLMLAQVMLFDRMVVTSYWLNATNQRIRLAYMTLPSLTT